jgi:hypothetical protein
MDLAWLGVCVCVCVCVVRWSGVNRNWKWVSSYVMHRLVPTHIEKNLYCTGSVISKMYVIVVNVCVIALAVSCQPF